MVKEYTPPENRVKLREITLGTAERMLKAAERWAGLAGFPCSIAIVDRTGAVVAFHKMDGATAITTDIAIKKAYSTAYFGGSTFWLNKMVDPNEKGELPGSHLIGVITTDKLRLNCISGGEPIRDDESRIIGGMGVSGVPAGIGQISDTTVAQVGISAIYD